MNDRKAWRIAVIAGKGGVGKTTTTINLGASLAAAGWRCLVVDCDPQSNLTSGLGLNPYDRRDTVAEVLCGSRSISDVIVETPQDGLDLVPASPDLSAVEDSLPGSIGRELRLRDALMRDGIDDRYAVVLFDTPPNFGYHTISALAAAHRVLVPLQMSGFALRGLKEVIRTVSVARRALNQDLEILGAVPTFVSRTRFSRDLLEAVGEVSPVRCFRTTIMHTVRLQETSLASVPIMVHAPGSRPDQEYRALAAEVVEALRGERSVPVGVEGDAVDEPSFEDVAAFRSAVAAGNAADIGAAEPTPAEPSEPAMPDVAAVEAAEETVPLAELTGHAADVRLEILSVDVPRYVPPTPRAAEPATEVVTSDATAEPATAGAIAGEIASDRAAMTWLTGVARAAAAEPAGTPSRGGRIGRLFRRR